MKATGNARSNAIYNPNEVRHPPPPNLMDAERDSELEQYIRSKYEFKRFMDKSALVASKLGPSRSASSVTSSGSLRSVSTPLTSLQTDSTTLSTTSTLTTSPTSSQPSSQLPMPPQRPSAVSTAMAPTRSFSQPLTSLQSHPPQPQRQATTNAGPPAPVGGVWSDLVSLQAPSTSSSLPLQFQMPPTQPLGMVNTQPLNMMSTQLGGQSAFPGTMSAYQTSMGSGVNPFTAQHVPSNPFTPQQQFPGMMQQQQFVSSPGAMTPFGSVNQAGQQGYFSTQPQQPMQQQANNFFHPQPTPGQGNTMFSSNAQAQQLLGANPSQQQQRFTPQPVTPQPQMLSATPQPQMQMTGHFMTPSPQLGIGSMGMATTQSPQLGMGATGMGMGMASQGQGQFMSSIPQPQTTMQMMQQQQLQQQQLQMQQQQQQQRPLYGAQQNMQMQPQGQFNPFSGSGQPFTSANNGFTGSGGQWGAM
ncbi:hypothetical protein H0H81_012066 [Sphagnurus paluster]|uniref:Uncharacterized protein n=1 Tax=Sphagnurus paluster TaxID=117069 RepID=A0A9P7FUR4_9AGAR|nr:hypothetical protein H0H81_012066 [Sphagnurus paluster]